MEKELAVLEADLEEKKPWDFAGGIRGEYERKMMDVKQPHGQVEWAWEFTAGREGQTDWQ